MLALVGIYLGVFIFVSSVVFGIIEERRMKRNINIIFDTERKFYELGQKLNIENKENKQ